MIASTTLRIRPITVAVLLALHLLSAAAFAPKVIVRHNEIRIKHAPINSPTCQQSKQCSVRATSTAIYSSPNDDNDSKTDTTNNNDSDENSDNNYNNSLLYRFLSPQIDDVALPLSDALVVQVIAPTLQVAWLLALQGPRPTWLQPFTASLFGTRGALLAPLLVHGAGLAVCWLLGALAAQAYKKDAVMVDKSSDDNNSYLTVFVRTIQAGAFATGVLILCTQLNTYITNDFQYLQYTDGLDPETDIRIQTTVVELVNDVFFEAIVLIPWRLFVARQNSTQGGQSR